ncbi:MAG: AMP-binding protein [Actinomycetota bacterium]|nr:AMP-binding protein [Actinomycetota bacterium]
MAESFGPEELGAWKDIADRAVWFQPWTLLHEADAPFDRWYADGSLNVSVNCLDRHLADRGHQTALLWEGEPGERLAITYRELHDDVISLARSLRASGLQIGDRVALHLGWIPEAVTAMLACARIGAVYTMLPTPLPIEALAQRIENFAPKVVFTQDGAWRRGAILPLKARVDEALSAVPGVELTVIVRRTGLDVPWYEGDRWYHDLLTEVRPGTEPGDDSPAELSSDHPLVVESLANRRGQPVSVTHAGGRMLLSAAVVHRYGSCEPGIPWVVGDASWIVNQASGIYAPLFWGDTTVMYEGALDTPTYARAWEIIERYKVSTILLTPSAARMLRDRTPSPPPEHNVASLRRIATLGERVDRSTLDWFTDVVGRGRIEVADGWGQVQLGGVVHYDAPVDPERMPDAGMFLVDETGQKVTGQDVGEVVLGRPWAGMALDVRGPAAADVVDVHWHRYPGVYATGDLARYDDAGAIEFIGRRDEVVSVTGQLVSLTEIRDVIEDQPFVVRADVFEVRQARGDAAVVAAVVLDRELTNGLEPAHVTRELLDGVRDVLGGLARPRRVLILDRFGDELTRSERRATLVALVAASDPHTETSHVLWSQVLATAGVSVP